MTPESSVQRFVGASPSELIQTSTFQTTAVKLTAVGSYLPPAIATNADLAGAHRLSLAPHLLQRALGVAERRVAAQHENPSDLLVRVGEAILKETGYQPTDIDRIICTCDPGDALAPATAVGIQARLGARCPAMDLSMSCAGWIASLDLASRCLATGERRILLLASAMASKVRFKELKHRAIFGDGAGGALIEAAPKNGSGLLATEVWADGRFYSAIYAPYPWSNHPPQISAESNGFFHMHPDQQVFFRNLEAFLPTIIANLLETAQVTEEQIDWMVLHQPSRPLFDHAVRLLDWMPRSKILGEEAFARYGNLVSAELPVMLDEAIRQGRVKRGDLVLLATYGAGFTGAAALVRY